MNWKGESRRMITIEVEEKNELEGVEKDELEGEKGELEGKIN